MGLSDPSKLVEDYGWSTQQIIGRYVIVGVACFVAIAAAWAYFTWTARQRRSGSGPA